MGAHCLQTQSMNGNPTIDAGGICDAALDVGWRRILQPPPQPCRGANAILFAEACK